MRGRGMQTIRLWLRSLLRKQQVEQELDQELQFHFDRQVAGNLEKGMSPRDARYAAMRELGNSAQIKEECRDHRRLNRIDNLIGDLRYTWRGLKNQPMLVLAAMLSIGLGVGVNTTIFSLGNELLLASPSARRADQLVHIRMGNGSSVSYREWRDLNESGALAGVAGYQIEREVTWRGVEATITLTPLLVTANFFDLLGVPVALGRGFSPEEAAAEREPNIVVISHGFWQRRLGSDPSVIGRTLLLNGRPHTVIGVLPSDLRAVPGYGVAPEVYLPLSRSLMPDLDQARAAVVQLIGRLRDDQSLGQGRAALGAAGERLARSYGDRNFGKVLEFTRAGGLGQGFAVVGAFFGLLLIVVGLVLMIACANVAGLLLARGSARRREIGIRLALGASRARLIQQMLTEALWLAFLGTIGGVALTFALMQLLNRMSFTLPIPIELHLGVNARLIAYAFLLVIMTTLACGLAPALQATRPALSPALKQDEPQYAHRRFTLRNLLVIAQVSVSMLLLVTAFLFLRNLTRIRITNPGFDAQHTLLAEVSFVQDRYTPQGRAAFLENAVAHALAITGVEAATFSAGVPLTMRSGMTTMTNMRIQNQPEEFRARYEENFVGPGYFQTMGIRLERGRDFRLTDSPGAPAVAIVNQAFERRYLGGKNAVGVRLLLPGLGNSYAAEIVGVVGDSKYRMLGEPQRDAIYEPFLTRGNTGRLVHILVRTRGNPQSTLPAISKMLGRMDASVGVDVQTIRSALAFAFLPSQIGAVLLGSMGLLGLVLAMVGLYAVISYGVSRRTAEIGIRMALGASRPAVVRLVLQDGAALVATGLLIGLILAVLVTRPLAMFLVAGLGPNDPVTLAATVALLLVVSVAATSVPARRATRVDPIVALRYE